MFGCLGRRDFGWYRSSTELQGDYLKVVKSYKKYW